MRSYNWMIVNSCVLSYNGRIETRHFFNLPRPQGVDKTCSRRGQFAISLPPAASGLGPGGLMVRRRKRISLAISPFAVEMCCRQDRASAVDAIVVQAILGLLISLWIDDEDQLLALFFVVERSPKKPQRLESA